MKLSQRFSHIYVEEAARGHSLTEELLGRFPKAERIWIDDYKEIFARPGQNFLLQKQSMKLILATKKEKFLYAGSSNAQDFGQPNFHYNALILNCLYNCGYCYLQGMYPSANIVIFVNLKDYFEATREAIRQRADPSNPLYLAISYDTDLLAFESIVPYSRKWIEFSRREPNLLIEIRTKSANYSRVSDLDPHERVILAWSLSPREIAKKYECLTPSFEKRLAAATRAVKDGWKVRLCFDPVIRIPGWNEIYKKCVEETFSILPPEKISDVSVGGFRMNIDYFKRMKRFRDDTDVLFYPYEREGNTVRYSPEDTNEMIMHMRAMLQNYLPRERIEVWT